MAMSGIAVQHADDGYSRRGNFGGSLAGNMVLIYLPDGTNVYGSGGGFEGYGRRRGLKVVKLCAQPVHLFKHFCCRMHRLAAMHSVTDRQTDRQIDRQALELHYGWYTNI